MEVSITDIPADFVFDKLCNVKGFESARGIVSIKRYYPCWSPCRLKESQFECGSTSLTAASSVTTYYSADESQCSSEGSQLDLYDRDTVQPGDCFIIVRNVGGSEVTVRTQFSRIDYHTEGNQRKIIMVCSVFDATITTTYTLDTAGSDCRLSVSWAMLPNGWEGRWLILRQRKPLRRNIQQHKVQELNDLKLHIEETYKSSLKETV